MNRVSIESKTAITKSFKPENINGNSRNPYSRKDFCYGKYNTNLRYKSSYGRGTSYEGEVLSNFVLTMKNKDVPLILVARSMVLYYDSNSRT